MGPYSSLSIQELTRRCVSSGEIAAWEEFVRRFHRLIAKVVIRAATQWSGASNGIVDDLIQETYLKLCADNYRILRNFEHRHPDAFVGYLQVLTANVVRDHFKTSFAQKRGSNQKVDIPEEITQQSTDGRAGSPKSIERAVLIDEINRQLISCALGEDQERNIRIFWLYYRTGLSSSAIADLPGIGLTTKGVESTILRLTRELRQRMVTKALADPEIIRGSREGILPA